METAKCKSGLCIRIADGEAPLGVYPRASFKKKKFHSEKVQDLNPQGLGAWTLKEPSEIRQLLRSGSSRNYGWPRCVGRCCTWVLSMPREPQYPLIPEYTSKFIADIIPGTFLE